MAAPNNAYNGRTLVDKKDNIIIHHQEANITDTIAILKERFYLDDVFINEKDGVSGFIGCCYASTFNYNMHATNRIGSLAKFRETVSGNGNWQSYRLFNDAGLNSKGFVGAPVITNNRIGSLAGYIPTKSAYFVDSDMVKWQYSVNGEAWTTPATTTGLGQRLEQDIPFGQTDLFKADDLVYFRAQVTNSEGTFIGSQSIQIQMRVRLVVLSTNSAASTAYQDWNSGGRINYYTDSLPLLFNVGSRVFQNDAPTLNDGVDVAAGGYSDGQRWYVVSYVNARDRNEITAMGNVTSSSGYPDNWPTNDPAYDRLVSNSRQGVYYEGNSKDDACINGQNQERPVEVWLRTTLKGNQTYYRGEDGAKLTGFFNVGGGVYQFVGGARVGTVYACAN